jgi:UDP-N-acetylmuramate: L-alanyl-gamma-D-glutamyl-meso-diaminopimelate ligase
MGIGGIAMGTLASMLREKGFAVQGSDQNYFPPMSTHLESLHIPLFRGYDRRHLERSPPDLVVIGNVIRRDNPEARFVLQRGIPYVSMTAAIARFFLPAHESIVVAGTHGKSTTSALLAWVLDHAGWDPSALIGGFVKNWGRSYRLGSGRYMVLEGDEYDTAFFDKTPKFLHYLTQVGIITSIEYDHADIYPDFATVKRAFRGFVDTLPASGTLVVNGDDPHCMDVARSFTGSLVTYGWEAEAAYRLLGTRFQPGSVEIDLRDPQGVTRTLTSTLPGRHNAANAVAVAAAAREIGMSHDVIQEGLATFRGVNRRQEIVGEVNGVVIVDDFAHHPTAVRETLAAIRRYCPGRRLLAAFEPRTNSSRRNVFQVDYASAFDDADLICIKEPQELQAIPAAERLDTARLVADIARRNKPAHRFADTETLLAFLAGHCRSGDAVLAMSNGSFDDLPRRLLRVLEESCGTRAS